MASIGCVHRIRQLNECADIRDGSRKVECGACTLQNEAGGALGEYAYLPDGPDGQRCVREK